MENGVTKVDVHSHVFLEEMLGKAGKYGPELTEDGYRIGNFQRRIQTDKPRGLSRAVRPEQRVEDMDQLGIDKMGVTIPPPLFFYWAEEEIATRFGALYNDALANFCRPYPDRLFFLATLPLQNIEASVEEIDRVVKLGARGIIVGTDNIAGRELDDPALWPVYERIQQHDLPLLIHPASFRIAEQGEDQYNLSMVTGFVGQETVAVTRLMFGGVLDEFPNLKIVVSHGGGAVPYQWGRLELAARKMPGVKARRPLGDYQANFYLDVLVHDVRARQFLVEFWGADRLVAGTNFRGWDEIAGFDSVEELDLSTEDRQKIIGGNAVSLFKL